MNFFKVFNPANLIMLAIVMFTCSFSGCDPDDVTFNTALEGTIAVSETSEGTNVAFSETLNIDATADETVEKYKNKINGFTVKSVGITIDDFDGSEACLFNGTVAFAEKGATTTDLSFAVSDLSPYTLAQSGETLTLDISEGDLQTMAEWLEDDQAITIFFDGTLSETPVAFDVNVVVSVGVSASAL